MVLTDYIQTWLRSASCDVGETIAGMAQRPTIMTKWGPILVDGKFVHHTDRQTAR